MNNGAAKDDHIKVVVRSRPLNAEEKAANTPMLVTCDQERNQVSVAMNLGSKRSSKKYYYDMVFGQYSKQEEVYKAAIKPVVDEVLCGYNCTVFAYGQTGTGKTHTMEGNVDDPELMGMIPRAVMTIFEALEGKDDTEYNIKVSFLELYNEELQDLLSPTDDVKLRIVDDKSKIGAGVSCHNLEEVMVRNPEDVLREMRKAMAKRQVGETKLNKASSRSHCIFTLTAHMREVTPEGEDLLKVGKLNLVDLAGSECIGRSGAKNQRAREAGNINKSLLTLGRVISALVEKTPHIPYRDSKLTRLLQESLGGRAKTCIIATVAPSVQCLDETISTLEYASRAKSIKNKPEVNQRMTKKALIKEYAEDLERLRQELAMARAKDGVFLDECRYNEMVTNLESQKLQIEELEDILDLRQKELSDLQDLFEDTKDELEETKGKLSEALETVEELKAELEQVKIELEKQKILVEETKVLMLAHKNTEGKLQVQTKDLQGTLGEAKADVSQLHAKIERKEAVQVHNTNATNKYHNDSLDTINRISADSSAFFQNQVDHHQDMHQSLARVMSDHKAQTQTLLHSIEKLGAGATGNLKALADDKVPQMRSTASDLLSEASQTVQSHTREVNHALSDAASKVDAPLKEFMERILADQNEMLQKHLEAVQSQLAHSTERVLAFASAHTAMLDNLSAMVAKDAEESRRALETQTKGVETFVSSERDRIEGAASTLLQQVSQMLVSFKSEAQNNLDSMLVQTQTSCQTSVENILRAELQTKKHVQDAVHHTKSWCDERQGFYASFSSSAKEQVDQLSTQLEHGGETVQHASQVLHEKVDALRTSVTQGSAATVSNLQGVDGQLASSCAAIKEDTERFVAQVQSDQQTAAERAIHQENSVESWGEDRQTTVLAQKENTSAYATQLEAGLRSMELRCNTYVESDLNRDMPTGQTPRKKKYAFVSTIARTRQHDDILEAYRGAKASSAVGPNSFDLSVTMEDVEGADFVALEYPVQEDTEETEEMDIEQAENDTTLVADDGEDSDSDEEDQENDARRPVSEKSQSRSELSEISNVLTAEEFDKGSIMKKTRTSSSSSSPESEESSFDAENSAPCADEEQLTRETVLKMKVADLRKELSSRSLSQLGAKAALQSRLLSALEL